MVWWVNQNIWTAVLPRLCLWYLPRQYALTWVRNFFCTHSQHKVCQIGQTIVRDPLCHVTQTDDGISIPGVTEPSAGHRQCQLYWAAGRQWGNLQRGWVLQLHPPSIHGFTQSCYRILKCHRRAGMFARTGKQARECVSLDHKVFLCNQVWVEEKEEQKGRMETCIIHQNFFKRKLNSSYLALDRWARFY